MTKENITLLEEAPILQAPLPTGQSQYENIEERSDNAIASEMLETFKQAEAVGCQTKREETDDADPDADEVSDVR